jgi:hypothetical protein
MTITISDTDMTSDVTRHTARYLADVPNTYAYAPPWGWSVSWFPERAMTRNEAITAMTIAETVAVHEFKPVGAEPGDVDPVWLHIDQWAAELGITGPHAVAEASLSPEDFTEDDEHPNAKDSMRAAGGEGS